MLLLQSDVTQNSTTATCSGGGTTAPSFQVPSPWPTCVPYLNCSSPPIDPLVMNYDWTDTKLTMPGLSVKFAFLLFNLAYENFLKAIVRISYEYFSVTRASIK